MTNYIVLSHPDDQSLQASLFEKIKSALQQKGELVLSSQLYKEDFPPLLDLDEIRRGSSTDELVIRYQNQLKDCGRLILCYPDWWGMPPAILKGWLDRVLSTETAFAWEGDDFLDKTWIPLLEGKEAVIFVSGDGELDAQWLEQLWDKQILGKCGMTVSVKILDRLYHRSYHEIQDWMEEQIKSL